MTLNQAVAVPSELHSAPIAMADSPNGLCNADASGAGLLSSDAPRIGCIELSPSDVFDDDASPGGNGSLRQGIYDPERLLLWVSAGEPPVPENPFVCFSLGELLNFPNAIPCPSPAIE